MGMDQAITGYGAGARGRVKNVGSTNMGVYLIPDMSMVSGF